MLVALTGASGFIGSYTAASLKRAPPPSTTVPPLESRMQRRVSASDRAGLVRIASARENREILQKTVPEATFLDRSGALDLMEKQGIDILSYFQVDNPLVRGIDPTLPLPTGTILRLK